MKDNSLQKESRADRFASDPRIIEAKKLILNTMEEYKQKITVISPSDPKKELRYKELIEEFNRMRGGNLWYPYIGSGMGNGALVELLDGSIKYDFIGGIGVHYWGHNHPDIVDAALNAAIENTVLQGHLQQNFETVEFSELLLQNSTMDCCFFSTSGAMANENALKIALQKNSPASRILAFENCFAGRTLALSQITDKPAYREGLPDTLYVDYLPFYDPENPEKSTEKAISVLKNHLARHPKKYGAFIGELIRGEAGFYPGSHRFFSSLMSILKKEGIAIIADEIQTFGRTDRLFAYQHFELEEFVDIVTIGKLSQVCATLFRKDFQPKPGLLSQTFTGSTATLRCGKMIIQSLLNDGYFGTKGKIQKLHEYFTAGLENLQKKYPNAIKGPWGIGAMIAFTPFGGNKEKVLEFSRNLFRDGVISFIAGENPMRIRFLIPVGAVKEKDIDEVLKIIENLLKAE